MNQLRLKLAIILLKLAWKLDEYAVRGFRMAANATPDSPASLGKVVNADGPDPTWKPEQRGSVIVQEPDIVRAERELNDKG